jgi:hypothetical protein
MDAEAAAEQWAEEVDGEIDYQIASGTSYRVCVRGADGELHSFDVSGEMQAVYSATEAETEGESP